VPNWLTHTYAIVGILVSALGAWLTIRYANEARRSADAAKDAAEMASTAANEARAQIKSIDWVLHFGDMTSTIVGMLDRLNSAADWVKISSDCTRLRSMAAVASTSTDSVSDEELRKRLKTAPTQFASVANEADKRVRNSDGDADIIKMRKVLSGQHETFSLALRNASEKAGRNKL